MGGGFRGLFASLALACAGTAAAAALPKVPPQPDSCWGGMYTFEVCCKIYVEGLRGLPACWQLGFSYEDCCLPELPGRVERGLQLINEGDYRQASHTLLNLFYNFAELSGDTTSAARSWQGFEKAALEFQRSLDRLPSELSYAEVLFHGHGFECNASFGNPWEDLHECCPLFLNDVRCDTIFQLISNALGRRMRQRLGGEDAYYEDFSEHWAFHFFSPSIMMDTTTKPPPSKMSGELYKEAFALNGALAGALAAGGEPLLGIVWAQHLPQYTSLRFHFGVYHLTRALHALQAQHPGRPVHFFEVGAGYGSMPRLVADARQRLLDLQPPVDVWGYAIFDVQAAVDLQRWYLNRTLGERVDVRVWPAGAALPEASALRGPRVATDPLQVDLVARDQRDAFAHVYSQEHSGSAQRPLRLLVAVNSWHEFPLSEYYWYYNTFVAGPTSLMGVDYVFYVSNRGWYLNDVKERLILSSGPGHNFEVDFEHCTHITCWRLLRRS